VAARTILYSAGAALWGLCSPTKSWNVEIAAFRTFATKNVEIRGSTVSGDGYEGIEKLGRKMVFWRVVARRELLSLMEVNAKVKGLVKRWQRIHKESWSRSRDRDPWQDVIG